MHEQHAVAGTKNLATGFPRRVHAQASTTCIPHYPWQRSKERQASNSLNLSCAIRHPVLPSDTYSTRSFQAACRPHTDTVSQSPTYMQHMGLQGFAHSRLHSAAWATMTHKTSLPSAGQFVVHVWKILSEVIGASCQVNARDGPVVLSSVHVLLSREALEICLV